MAWTTGIAQSQKLLKTQISLLCSWPFLSSSLPSTGSGLCLGPGQGPLALGSVIPALALLLVTPDRRLTLRTPHCTVGCGSSHPTMPGPGVSCLLHEWLARPSGLRSKISLKSQRWSSGKITGSWTATLISELVYYEFTTDCAILFRGGAWSE